MLVSGSRVWPGLGGIRVSGRGRGIMRRRGALGCATCGPARLGQVDCTANPGDIANCGNPLTAETPYSYGMTTEAVNNELYNAAINPSNPTQLQYTPQFIPSTIPSGAAGGIPTVPGGVTQGGIMLNANNTVKPTSSSLTTYLPWLIFGVGAIALLRRR